jgi:hypothetical protein
MRVAWRYSRSLNLTNDHSSFVDLKKGTELEPLCPWLTLNSRVRLCRRERHSGASKHEKNGGRVEMEGLGTTTLQQNAAGHAAHKPSPTTLVNLPILKAEDTTPPSDISPKPALAECAVLIAATLLSGCELRSTIDRNETTLERIILSGHQHQPARTSIRSRKAGRVPLSAPA